MTTQEIVEIYKTERSMRKVTAKAGISNTALKKILITNGIYPSERAKEVARLTLMGMEPQEIAEYLHISVKTVKSNMPYVRGRYRDNQTPNAIKIAQWRESKRSK